VNERRVQLKGPKNRPAVGLAARGAFKPTRKPAQRRKRGEDDKGQDERLE
jgi:hypothetical protein